MRFTINREEFLKSLSIAVRAVSSKNANPILANLKIELDETGLYITGSDNDITIKTMIPYASDGNQIISNYKEGTTLIDAKLIVEIIRHLEGNEITLDVIDSTIAMISDGRSEFKLNSIRGEEYPDLDLDADGCALTLSNENFGILIDQTAFAASIKEQRPLLTAINLEASGGKLTATATDSARMARKTIDIDLGIDFVANISARTLTEVKHLIEGCAEVSLAVSDKKALFSFGRSIVATRLLSGNYPNTKNIVPRMLNYTLKVNSSDIIKAIERVSLLSRDKNNAVSLSMSEKSVEVSSKSVQMGSATEQIADFDYEGQQLEVSFNNTFVVDAIRALGAEEVTLAFVGEMKPFVVRNDSDDTIIQVVTPMRTY